MKLKTLAKATLALGLLTTGVITSEGQAVKAAEKQERVQHLYDIKDLHRYYSAPSFEYSNISGRLKTTMVLTLYALTKRSKSPIILTRKR